ncbi:acylphosphatase [Bacillus taeanensis]|uniref:acylphosphatase n=1 Tax=Bacillus taeanensis TaxID=273032 RepID=A0A366Y303_9BACI|nr:acylphosphatase [Bacillus taeanensis]RBW70764.1 acylphosphatase [Bacillus taeanensis]
MIRWHIIIHGRVQGVGFRAFTQQHAKMHNIKGSVQNKLNGTVEIDAQGKKKDMRSFISAIKKGTPFAKVTDIEIAEIGTLKNDQSFNIVY